MIELHPILWIALVCSFIPCLMTVWNHLVFRKPPASTTDRQYEISILIPARNEEANIESAVHAALEATNTKVEVIVLDDHSTDRTRELVNRIVNIDDRVRLESAPSLPDGWCGKQHACFRLSEHARYPLMLFVDADVTMSKEAPSRLAAFMDLQKADLVSAFPHQVTETFFEKLLIPLIEFILLGYLPIQIGRYFQHPGFGAGCGQVFLAKKQAYQEVGGHGSIKASMHDGVKLPRAFRLAGFKTDLCAGNSIISCRMYQNAPETWAGLLKNAHEGVASAGSIIPFSFLLIGSALLPLTLLIPAFMNVSGFPISIVLITCLLAFLPRALNKFRFNQSWLGLLLHPLAIILFLIIQWQSFTRIRFGKKPTWKGRAVG